MADRRKGLQFVAAAVVQQSHREAGGHPCVVEQLDGTICNWSVDLSVSQQSRLFNAAVPDLRKPFMRLAVFSLAYYLAARLGILTALPPEGVVVIWPPNAIVLLALLSATRREWLSFFFVTVVTEVVADYPDYPLWAAMGYGVVNFSEAALAALLLAALGKGVPRITGVRHFVLYLFVGPLLASGSAALLGAAIYKLGSPDLDYLHYWRVYWFGDALGLLLVGTILLSWPEYRAIPRRGTHVAIEGATLAIGLSLTAGWALLSEPDTPRVYLIFPFLMWAALRFGIRGACLAVIATTGVAVGSAMTNVGPFSAMSNIDTVVSLQGLIAVVVISTFMLAFSTEEALRATDKLKQEVRRRSDAHSELRETYVELERINANLDRLVASRTNELRQSLARNELLLKELQHRVKNNLQIVSSLLSMHARGLSDGEALRKFGEVRAQVLALAATYEILYRTESTDVVDFCHVVPELCHEIGAANGGLVSLTTHITGNALISADSALALSLVLNELVTNSVKHAAAQQPVAITVSCRREEDHLILKVVDDGPGLPPGFDADQAQGFGFRMIRRLIKQANGELRLCSSGGGGVAIQIRVPLAG
jgi:two-component sensor histidine kinase/integral membrane sensor domain MASE1